MSKNGMEDADAQEDKKCRICGFADISNVLIFNSAQNKSLFTKIVTVYPIVLFQNDPLPKNICKKCVYNVSFMYNDIQRVMKTQAKWISNVRAVQPNHDYIRILDMIESANKVTKASIKERTDIDIAQQTIHRSLLRSNAQATSSAHKESNNTILKSYLESKSATCNDIQQPEQFASTSTASNNDVAGAKMTSIKFSEIRDIKSILELNGCTLLKVGSKKTDEIDASKKREQCFNSREPELSNSNRSKSDTRSASNIEKHKDIEEIPIVEIKDEPIVIEDDMDNDDDDEDNVALSTIASVSLTKTPSVAPPPLTIKCRYCCLQFSSMQTLAAHQVIHLRLSIPKLFQKKYLEKSLRRGRLITVQDRKCLRCLNCWRIFVDNKSILDHWSLGECDFYCHICGKEFQQAPKMLREHVPAAHGITYRSSKVQRLRLSTKASATTMKTPIEEHSDYKIFQAASEQEPKPCETVGDKPKLSHSKANTSRRSVTKAKKARSSLPATRKSPVSCPVCHKDFQNGKARNSHMRKHKPSYARGELVLPPGELFDNTRLRKRSYCEEKDRQTLTPTPTRSATETKRITPTTMSPAPVVHVHTSSTVTRAKVASSAATAASPPCSASTSIPSTSNASTTVLRGVRTKYVNRRNDFTINSAIKVKPISALRGSTSLTPQQVPEPTQTWVTPPTEEINICPIKAEPMDIEDFTPAAISSIACSTCGVTFASKAELSSHRQHCQASMTLKCEFCDKSCIDSADHQLHRAQVHCVPV